MGLPLNKIIQGDSLEVLKTLPAESVDCIITSPPYYGLRDYGTGEWIGGDTGCNHKVRKNTKIESSTLSGGKKTSGHQQEGFKEICAYCGSKRVDKQIGLEKSLVEYLGKMLAITAELKRVLKKTGTLWWNHGDSYAGSGKGYGDKEPDPKFKSILRGGGTARSRTLRPERSEIPTKSLMLQAHRLVIRMIDEQGWKLRNQIIWHKPNCMPSSATDRFTVDYEPMFFFSKSTRYFFIPQYEPWTAEEKNDVLRAMIDHPGYDGKHQDGKNAQGIKGQPVGNPTLGRNKRTVWKIATNSFSEAHFATFPPSLVEIPIRATCPAMICQKCGKARETIFEPSEEYAKYLGKSWTEDTDKSKKLRSTIGFKANSKNIALTADYHKVGMTDCGCKAGWRGGGCIGSVHGRGHHRLGCQTAEP